MGAGILNECTCKRVDRGKKSLRDAVLSVRFEVGVSLLLAPTGAEKRGPKAPFPLEDYAGIQPVIRKKVPAGAPAGAGSY